MKIPFYSTLGIEFTYMLSDDVKGKSRGHRDTAYKNLVMAELLEHGFTSQIAHDDEGCLEINSPGFDNLKNLKNFYKFMENVVKQYPFETHRESDSSGGGHIHVALKKSMQEDTRLLLLFLINLHRDITNRPYLGWIFNEWCNVQSAKNFNEQSHTFNYVFRDSGTSTFNKLLFEKNPEVPQDFKKDMILSTFSISKGYAIRLDTDNTDKKPHTFEFRFFDAKRNWFEVKRHVNFANAYTQYIENLSLDGKLVKTTCRTKNDTLKLAKRDVCLDLFNALLDEIGLDVDDYEYFIDLNYRKRKKEGWIQ